MENVLTAMGLEVDTGVRLIALALGGGLSVGMCAAVAFPELPWSTRRTTAGFGTLIALLALAGALALAVTVGMLIFAHATAPMIVFTGLGLLAGPPIAQFLERFGAPKAAGLFLLLAMEVAIVAAAQNYIA